MALSYADVVSCSSTPSGRLVQNATVNSDVGISFMDETTPPWAVFDGGKNSGTHSDGAQGSTRQPE
jgi:hypothetical protein